MSGVTEGEKSIHNLKMFEIDYQMAFQKMHSDLNSPQQRVRASISYVLANTGCYQSLKSC